MLAAGILIILGVVLDIVVHGFSGIHVVLIASGLLLIVINSIPGIKFPGRRIGKLILSMTAIVLTCLFLAGLFPSLSSGMSGNVSGAIKKAEQIAESKSTAEAAAYLDEIIMKGTWNRDLAFTAAELYRKHGQYTDSTGRYYPILLQVPFDIEVRHSLAQSMIGQKNFDPAIEQLSYIMQLEPQNADICETLGDCYWSKGDNIRGIYYYKMAANQAADSVEKHVKLAQAYADMHSDAEAMAEYRKAKDLAKSFDEEMLVYNGYSSMKSEASTQSEAQQKEAGQ